MMNEGTPAGDAQPNGHPSTVAPHRIQRKRAKGWKMPPNTVNVCRPGRWGNPYRIEEHGREEAIALFARSLEDQSAISRADIQFLRGKNRACWCAPDQACHADVLLAIANASLDRE